MTITFTVREALKLPISQTSQVFDSLYGVDEHLIKQLKARERERERQAGTEKLIPIDLNL